jgi:hypothetical protein
VQQPGEARENQSNIPRPFGKSDCHEISPENPELRFSRDAMATKTEAPTDGRGFQIMKTVVSASVQNQAATPREAGSTEHIVRL